jgi:hypothetical protein
MVPQVTLQRGHSQAAPEGLLYSSLQFMCCELLPKTLFSIPKAKGGLNFSRQKLSLGGLDLSLTTAA